MPTSGCGCATARVRRSGMTLGPTDQKLQRFSRNASNQEIHGLVFVRIPEQATDERFGLAARDVTILHSPLLVR